MKKYLFVFLSLIALQLLDKQVYAQDGCRDMNVVECTQEIARLLQKFENKFSVVVGQIQKTEMPVGSIITSALPPDQFLSSKNPQFDRDKWVVADGRSLPSGSLYQEISGQTVAPDLGSHRRSKLVVDVISGTAPSGQNVRQLYTPEFAAADWKVHFGLRDITGNRCNGDYEQDVDQFSINVDKGAVVARGRTHNFKHNCWGKWNPGSTNYVGIATIKNNLHYYVKIN